MIRSDGRGGVALQDKWLASLLNMKLLEWQF